MPPKKCKDEEVERKMHGLWRNVVAVFNPRNNKWEKRLVQFKMLIYFMMTLKNVVPLGFMYKHGHGCFLPVGEGAAAELKKNEVAQVQQPETGRGPRAAGGGSFPWSCIQRSRSRCICNFMSMEVVRWLRGSVLSHLVRLHGPG
jgi:hypothetical protein